ncbi:hypothetical protein [Ammoniphilus sp. YIM 78166]|uniref:hypothetical protein n=1 Tax=Ammoniphilus sp. YIM 78166 TaxID=1644106 RepID=UPI00106F615C|nr:hypothetical protein [Ammoniphilus sp. YIM 78166]
MELTLAHWFYLLGTLLIILTMLFRKNVVVPAILVTFAVAWSFTGSFITGLQSTFRASLTAAGALFDIFLIIAVMTALLNSLKSIEADKRMIIPFQRVMVNGHISFWILIVSTYAISLFFWPTPAVPLVGAILIPVAIRAGLPAIGAGMAVALAGQGMALSSDYVIQIAPMLSSTTSHLDVAAVADRALVLSLITGIVAIVLGYLSIRKTITPPSDSNLKKWDLESSFPSQGKVASSEKGKWFAVIVPLSFLAVVGYMVYVKFFGEAAIQGGAGAALIGGTALLLLIAASFTHQVKEGLENVSHHIIEGLLFAFKAMGAVLPIAGFFFLGNNESAGKILGLEAEVPSFLFELIQSAHNFIPGNEFLTGFGILLVGMITGLDGSGFSGLPLTGALSGALGSTVGIDPVTLAAIGQMGAIWVGGGTLIAWSSLVAVAGFAKVPVMELVRKNFFPVVIGLVVSTLFALLFF